MRNLTNAYLLKVQLGKIAMTIYEFMKNYLDPTQIIMLIILNKKVYRERAAFQTLQNRALKCLINKVANHAMFLFSSFF